MLHCHTDEVCRSSQSHKLLVYIIHSFVLTLLKEEPVRQKKLEKLKELCFHFSLHCFFFNNTVNFSRFIYRHQFYERNEIKSHTFLETVKRTWRYELIANYTVAQKPITSGSTPHMNWMLHIEHLHKTKQAISTWYLFRMLSTIDIRFYVNWVSR